MRTVLVVLCLSCCFAAPSVEPHQIHESEHAAAELPVTITITLPETGYVHVRATEKPQIDLDAHFPEAASMASRASCSARLPVGEHAINIDDRFGRNPDGPLKLVVDYLPESDESELNNVPDQARAIEPGAVELAIAPKGDTDRLRLELDEPAYVEVEAGESLDRLHVQAHISDELGVRRGTNFARIDFPGSVDIAVSSRIEAWNLRPGTLHVRTYPLVDRLEPNDGVAQAVPAELDTWYRVEMAPQGDRDCFRLTVPDAGVIVAEFADAPFGLKPMLLDAEGAVVDTWSPLVVEEAGEHVVALTHYRHWDWGREPFDVRWHWARSGDPQEPIDGEPAVIESDRPYVVQLPHGGDRDRFRIDVEEERTLLVESLAPPPVDARFAVDGADGRRTGMPLLVHAPAGSSVELSLALREDAEGSVDPFLIQARSIRRADPLEPNDTRSQAVAVTPGEAAVIGLYPSGDEDWFRFELDAAATVAVELSHGELARPHWPTDAFRASVHDAEGKELAELVAGRDRSGREGLLLGPVELDASGSYLLQLRPSSVIRQEPLLLRLYTSRMTLADDDASGVFIMGVEQDAAGRLLTRALATESGGSLLVAERAEDIGARFDEVVQRAAAPAEEKTVSGGESLHTEIIAIDLRWLLLLLALLVVLVLLVVVVRRRGGGDA